MFLLDTNIVSELRKARPHGGVLAWLNAVPESDLFVSAVTLGEIQRGIEITKDQDPVKALEIAQWADRLAGTHNILPMDAPTFRVWARLMHHQSDALFEDAMIAATALVHQLTVVTRNTRDFAAFKVLLLNPFETLP
ncbi:MAG: type II toxin-antitoxin system VapC family toxin [Gammaproteobacteria bacterium]|uniref:type II toxin-antitoxin system VapC family toxin n=1 Tax=Rhodoferax sp. TaxID=50421 RepID=UPI0017AB4507|nr:type II toxin-antitoxin system VapC family toxin [Rhodoferax sp.]MBU3898084.1 type II toxin-antitoxin system VapC family toxin [Gammaproteobacteria bacterium]MBA3056399.1 type II toxin-antitoxin system VapC family toxin [Rhodoferax sp.]MBU3999159.1 type II toxin-antitoxin system VapC family toxin [Gammaproteobacteria bacterium]MBU4081722.1 type II toxin-antitoxin system VapC family toxin [Gammaproteobacteria bacterium]MBU4114622.1 type II toxin-antitoxin system VapC family toxin [Gammaprote